MNSSLISFDKKMKYWISDNASILKNSCMQTSICCKFLLALSDSLKNWKYGICFAFGRRSALCLIPLIQSSLMYNCLPDLNATRVIKITERNKIWWPIVVRLRVEKKKFPFRQRFLYLVCRKRKNVTGLCMFATGLCTFTPSDLELCLGKKKKKQISWLRILVQSWSWSLDVTRSGAGKTATFTSLLHSFSFDKQDTRKRFLKGKFGFNSQPHSYGSLQFISLCDFNYPSGVQLR